VRHDHFAVRHEKKRSNDENARRISSCDGRMWKKRACLYSTFCRNGLQYEAVKSAILSVHPTASPHPAHWESRLTWLGRHQVAGFRCRNCGGSCSGRGGAETPGLRNENDEARSVNVNKNEANRDLTRPDKREALPFGLTVVTSPGLRPGLLESRALFKPME